MTTFKWHATTPLTVTGVRKFWDVRYQHAVTPWDRGQTSPALTGWLQERTLQPCRILVPGCGRGYEVIELARRGFDVVALDISAEAVRHVQHKLSESGLEAELIQADLFDWAPDHAFDAVYEQTCLCALLPEQMAAYALRLADWIRPEGDLFALFMQTGKSGGPPFHCDIEHMRQLFPTVMWRWPTEPLLEIPHPSGVHELGAVLRRRKI